MATPKTEPARTRRTQSVFGNLVGTLFRSGAPAPPSSSSSLALSRKRAISETPSPSRKRQPPSKRARRSGPPAAGWVGGAEEGGEIVVGAQVEGGEEDGEGVVEGEIEVGAGGAGDAEEEVEEDEEEGMVGLLLAFRGRAVERVGRLHLHLRVLAACVTPTTDPRPCSRPKQREC
jgi:hypothetical protein